MINNPKAIIKDIASYVVIGTTWYHKSIRIKSIRFESYTLFLYYE